MTIHIYPGARFNKLKAVEPAASSKNAAKRWVFDCDCGNRITTYVYRVNKSEVKSCRNCTHAKHRSSVYGLSYDGMGGVILKPGMVFNRLTVIESLGRTKKHKKLWRFRCECGNSIDHTATDVVAGNTKSCGCLIGSLRQSRRDPKTGAFTNYETGEGLSSAERVWKSNHYADDGCPLEDFLRLSQLDCHYCGAKPARSNKSRGQVFIYNGLDRKDSSKDHSPDNLVPCCWDCNQHKGTTNYQQFIDWIRKVAHHCESFT